MVMALSLSLPGKLLKCGQVLRLDEKYLKEDGHRLINWFSKPRPATKTKPERRVSQQAIFAARKEILGLYMADAVEEYLVQLVMATRTPAKFDPEMAEWIAYGASPRGSIALDRCARAHAWLAGRDFVSPEDIQAVLFDVLRHRIILSFEAEAAGIDQDRVIQRILDVVAVA